MYKVNLLPDGLQKGSAVDMRRIKRLAMVAVVGLVVIGGFGVYLVSDYSRLTQRAEVTSPGTQVASKSETAPGKEGTEKEHHVLPETTRARDDVRSSTPDASVKDPFVGPMSLTGIIFSGGEGDLAIIESDTTGYVVATGDTVSGLWTVVEIDREMVVLQSADGREMRLELSGR